MRIIKLSAVLVFVLVNSFLAAAVELSDYEYTRELNVNCTDFLGYAKVIPDGNMILNSQNMNNIYVDSEYFITKEGETKNMNWFAKDSNTENLELLKDTLDGNDFTYYLVKNQNEVEIELKNPYVQTFNKMVIRVKDSEINYIKFADITNEDIPTFSTSKDGFVYTYIFDKKISADDVRPSIFFNNILKISEIEFYDMDETPSLYFYVNNDCKRTFNVYYGSFGENLQAYQRRDASRIIDAKMNVEKVNNLYNGDFDKDGILNSNDNCPRVSNNDQKDINYNGIGDACEDFDSDGIMNINDNCPETYNYEQTDVDQDGIGDACDKEDGRFSERNKYIFYITAVIIVGMFAFIGYLLMSDKKDSKK